MDVYAKSLFSPVLICVHPQECCVPAPLFDLASQRLTSEVDPSLECRHLQAPLRLTKLRSMIHLVCPPLVLSHMKY
jgi:hypothetical protein